jgi:hypothetical protein
MKLITPSRLIAFAAAMLSAALVDAHPAGLGTKQLEQSSGSLCFVENKGQVTDQHRKRRSDIDYKLETHGMSIFIGNGQIHYQWYPDESAPEIPAGEKKKQEPIPVKAYRMDMVLVGANIKAPVVASEPQAQYFNYYLPQCPDGATAKTYRRITYKNIYPNIDWVLYTNDSGLKYDFVVRAGGKASDIKLR